MPDEMISIAIGGDTPDESPEAPDLEGAKIGAHTGDYSGFFDAQQPAESAHKQVTKAVDSLRLHKVSIKKLERELAEFMKTVDKMFSAADMEADMKAIELSEIELSVGINAEGSFSLMAMGAKVADTRTVLLRFKRKS